LAAELEGEANQAFAPENPLQGEEFIEMNDLVQVHVNGIDLNARFEDDLGGVDDLLEIADNLEAQPPVGPQLEDVILEDALPEADPEEQVQL